jgi:hypothetical protein
MASCIHCHAAHKVTQGSQQWPCHLCTLTAHSTCRTQPASHPPPPPPLHPPHRDQLDEVWVPSHWHQQLLARQGVSPSKVAIIPESLDTALFDPALWPSTGLPGKRRYAFLAVFKLEDRKGWKEVLQAYMQVRRALGWRTAAPCAMQLVPVVVQQGHTSAQSAASLPW